MRYSKKQPHYQERSRFAEQVTALNLRRVAQLRRARRFPAIGTTASGFKRDQMEAKANREHREGLTRLGVRV